MANWWNTIQESGRKVKSHSIDFLSPDVFIVILVILVGLAAFGLGRLSTLEEKRPAVRVFQAEATDEQPLRIGGQYVASRRGSKYHFPWCSGAKSMNESNKIWFDSVEDARNAGYTAAKNCKGLE